jgi:hypothetical protein
MQSNHCKKEIPTLDIRIRAIFCCIWFGTIPWQIYESKKHYQYNYWSHLKLNWGMVWVWLTNWELDIEEIDFEQEVNPNWKVVFKNMFTWIR